MPYDPYMTYDMTVWSGKYNSTLVMLYQVKQSTCIVDCIFAD